MAWKNEQKHYLLQWYNPQRTNAPISGYHVIVEYPNSQSSRSTDKFKIEKTFYINVAETNEIQLDDVCMNLFDKVKIKVINSYKFKFSRSMSLWQRIHSAQVGWCLGNQLTTNSTVQT